MNRVHYYIILLFIAFIPELSYSGELSLEAIKMTKDASGIQTYSISLQILAIMTVLSLLPSIVLMMTSFTRIIIVLSMLRQAIGMAQTPTNQILIGISLFLTFFIMAPVLQKANTTAIQPYVHEKISAEEAFSRVKLPFRKFMIAQTRENDLSMFLKISGNDKVKDLNEVPFTVLMPAFLTSELKTAFQIGFILFLPFLIIDLVVASVLMSMGMMMLSPLIISLPFKVMLFVLVDGWALIISTLAASFSV